MDVGRICKPKLGSDTDSELSDAAYRIIVDGAFVPTIRQKMTEVSQPARLPIAARRIVLVGGTMTPEQSRSSPSPAVRVRTPDLSTPTFTPHVRQLSPRPPSTSPFVQLGMGSQPVPGPLFAPGQASDARRLSGSPFGVQQWSDSRRPSESQHIPFGSQPPAPDSQRIFGTPNQSPDSQHLFGSQPPAPDSQRVFGTPNQSQHLFGSQPQVHDSQHLFGTPNQLPDSQHLFGSQPQVHDSQRISPAQSPDSQHLFGTPNQVHDSQRISPAQSPDSQRLSGAQRPVQSPDSQRLSGAQRPVQSSDSPFGSRQSCSPSPFGSQPRRSDSHFDIHHPSSPSTVHERYSSAPPIEHPQWSNSPYDPRHQLRPSSPYDTQRQLRSGSPYELQHQPRSSSPCDPIDARQPQQHLAPRISPFARPEDRVMRGSHHASAESDASNNARRHKGDRIDSDSDNAGQRLRDNSSIASAACGVVSDDEARGASTRALDQAVASAFAPEKTNGSEGMRPESRRHSENVKMNEPPQCPKPEPSDYYYYGGGKSDADPELKAMLARSQIEELVTRGATPTPKFDTHTATNRQLELEKWKLSDELDRKDHKASYRVGLASAASGVEAIAKAMDLQVVDVTNLSKHTADAVDSGKFDAALNHIFQSNKSAAPGNPLSDLGFKALEIIAWCSMANRDRKATDEEGSDRRRRSRRHRRRSQSPKSRRSRPRGDGGSDRDDVVEVATKYRTPHLQNSAYMRDGCLVPTVPERTAANILLPAVTSAFAARAVHTRQSKLERERSGIA